MNGAIFPDYAISYSDNARKTRLALAPAVRQVADDIEAQLTSDPDRFPERLNRGDDETITYRHPSPELLITFKVDRQRKVLYVHHYFAPNLRPPQIIFVSYSHKDKKRLEKLKSFLGVLEQQGLLKFWEDTQIVKGQPWERQIQEVLDAACAGLLLVSQDFLVSNFINDVELPKLLDVAQRSGKRVFWLHLSPSTVFKTHPEITKFQSILDEPTIPLEQRTTVKQKAALVAVTETLMDYAKAG